MSRADDWRVAARAFEALALLAEDRAARATTPAERCRHLNEGDRLRERARTLRVDAAREELRSPGARAA